LRAVQISIRQIEEARLFVNPTVRVPYSVHHVLDRARAGHLPTPAEAASWADYTNVNHLMAIAADLRDCGYGDVVSYSRKVFIPLTTLCRDTCHYCTFAASPR